MELKEFIEQLPFDTFNSLRKVVIERHQRHAEEIASVLEYLISQPPLCKAIFTSREACENVLIEKTNVKREMVVKAIKRFYDIVKQMRDSGVEPPFLEKEEKK